MRELLREDYICSENERRHAEWMNTPSMMLKPRLFIDGNKWCALFGENIQDGVAGFGDSPNDAYLAFDKAWFEELPKKEVEK